MNTKARNFLVEAIVPVLFLVGWYFGSLDSTNVFFPPLADIMSTFVDQWVLGDGFWIHFLPSIERMVIGYAIACVVGISVGFVIGLSHVTRMLANPMVNFFRSLPSAALIPLSMQLFGIGDWMKISLIAFVCVWPVLLNSIQGIDETDRTLIETAKSYGIRGWRRVFRLLIPSAAPRILSGMRVGLAFAIAVMIISEITASINGVGYFIAHAQDTFAITDMWSGIILLGLLGYILNLIFVVVESRVLRWYHASKAGADA